MNLFRKKWLILVLLAINSSCNLFAQEDGLPVERFGTLEKMVKPDSSKGMYVFDYPDKFSEVQEAEINLLCDLLFDKTGVETLIAIIPGVEFPYGSPTLSSDPSVIFNPLTTFSSFLWSEWDLNNNSEAGKGVLLLLINAENNEAISLSFSIPSTLEEYLLKEQLQPFLDSNLYYEGVGHYFEGIINYLLDDKLPEELIEESNSDIEENNIFQTYYSVVQVPNTMRVNGSFVVDPSSFLSISTFNEINSKCKDLKELRGNEIAVVLLNSIGGNNPHDFGTDLFNDWGIGLKGRDDGLLILLVMDKHRVEFITGYGLEEVLPDGLCYEIQQEEMVPEFKEDDYDQGLLNGINTVISIISDSEIPDYVKTYATVQVRREQAIIAIYSLGAIFLFLWGISLIFKRKLSFDMLELLKTIRFSFFILGLVIWFLYGKGYDKLLWIYASGFLINTIRWGYIWMQFSKEKNPYKKIQMLKKYKINALDVVYAFPFALIHVIQYKKRWDWRNMERFSEKSGLLMHKLTNAEEKEFLSKGQVTEEQIHSVEYDVWVTDDHSEILILEYPGVYSKYKPCPECNSKAWSQEHDITLKAATYSDKGKGEKKHLCKNCGYEKIVSYSIPKKIISSSSSSSSSGSSYSSSSSSSSGDSWGGGSSGGGGAGSSW